MGVAVKKEKVFVLNDDKTNQYDLSQLTSLQNWFLKYELQTIPNVSEVATIGGMVKQYQITININKLRSDCG